MEERNFLMKQLVEKLNQASESYYNGKGELMTDYEWDSMFDQLKSLEEETGVVLPDSPTNTVSETPSPDRRKSMSLPPFLSPRPSK